MTHTDTTAETTCVMCKKTFTYTVIHGFTFAPGVCTPCGEQRERDEASAAATAKANARATEWNELCPVEFRTIEEGGKTDLVRMAVDQPGNIEVLDWKYGARGLLLIGPSGKCKTRIAWRLLRREWDSGRKVKAMKAHRFGIEAVALQMSHGFREWFDELVEVPLLLIDDLGKGRLTDAVESHLFGLLDERSENGRPVIVTTNSNGKDLVDKMSADRGEPIVRRLRDYCDVMTLE